MSVTLGYLGTDYLLTRNPRLMGSAARPVTTAHYRGDQTGLPPSSGGQGEHIAA